MRNFVIITIILFLFQNSNSQTYYPFPTDTAHWNCLTWNQWSPTDIVLTNNQYILQGDTILGELPYNKVYYKYTNSPDSGEYIGGLREDSSKNIYFFPQSIHLYTGAHITFPFDTAENLLYTFDNLDSGMILPINSDYTEIKVLEIDSIFFGNHYRKRYKIFNEMLIMHPEFWIEGIGSTKDLFAPFTYEFEWTLYTLCYEDTVTYYINSPNGEDSCYYSINVGVNENSIEKLKVYPNPASQSIIIESVTENGEGFITIYNYQGQILTKEKLINSKAEIDINQFKAGIYVIEMINENEKVIRKFVKK